MGESRFVPVRGEFESTDWQMGLFAEKDRIEKLYGENGNICSVTSFSYEGSIEKLGNHVSSRMSYLKDLKRSVGEIVRLKKPVAYYRAYNKTEEVKEDGVFVHLNQMRLSCVNSRYRYCVLERRNGSLPPQYRFLRGYYELSDAKKEIFGILRSNNTIFNGNSSDFYYIYDTKDKKVYRCYPDIEYLKSTVRSSDDSQLIIPIYRYIYYGYAEPKKFV